MRRFDCVNCVVGHLVNLFLLTYMATINELCETGVLIPISGGLDEHEQPERLLYAFPHIVDWFDNDLLALQPAFDEGMLDPLEQVAGLLYDFVSGEDFAFYSKSHSMRPDKYGVWELKTPDVRLFGWFVSKGVFVIAEVNSAFMCKNHDLYAGHRDMVRYHRDGVNLDEPKFIVGDYADVL